MKVKANDAVKLAKAWLGKNEKDGTHKEIIDIYNSQKKLPRDYKVKYTDPWCATFITALFVKLNAVDMIYPECSCGKMIEGLKAKGVFIEDDSYVPNVGDLVFYDWNDNGVGDNTGWADHVGIVSQVINASFSVIEGNKSNAVGTRICNVNQKHIRGYAVPKYYKSSKELKAIAKEVIQGKWGNGTERYKRLTAAGYCYEDVQALVNKMVK